MGRPRDMKADIIRSVEHINISSSFSNVGIALTQNLIILQFKNTTDATVLLSENGTDDQYEFPPNSYETLDLQTNATTKAMAHKAKGLQFQVRARSGSLPSKGKFIIQGQYL